MFKNRIEAGKLLASKLIKFRRNKNVVVVALPRGGVPIGFLIAKEIKAPLYISLVKKIGHPFNKEYAIGSANLRNSFIRTDVTGISEAYIKKEIQNIRAFLSKKYKWYEEQLNIQNFENKIVILVDDGVATGSTLLSSIELIREQKPLKIIVVLPVAPFSSLKKIEKYKIVEEVICLSTPLNFRSISQFYDDFDEVEDSEVINYLKLANE